MWLSEPLCWDLTRLLVSILLSLAERKNESTGNPYNVVALRISRSVFRVTLRHATTASTSVVHSSLDDVSFLVKIYSTPGETPLYNVLHLSGWKHPSKAFSTLGRF